MNSEIVATRKNRSGIYNYSTLLFLSLHWASVAYINSSYLEQFVSQQTIDLLYVVAAILTITAFKLAPHALKHFGMLKLTTMLAAIEFITILFMAMTQSIYVASLAFVVQQIIITILYFNLDIMMEVHTGDNEGETGKQRGFFLTISNFASALAPFCAGLFIGSSIPDFSSTYLISALSILPFILFIYLQKSTFADPEYTHPDLLQGMRNLLKNRDVRNVVVVHFLLQVFFAVMVIYTPLYLHNTVGLNWQEIGIVISIALCAYVLFEYLIGYIADTYLGEKEMMIAGLIITGVSTSWFAFMGGIYSVIAWTVIMFITRVGASLIESTTEIYFFKHTKGDDADIIALFRITRPFSIVVGAACGSFILFTLSYELLFVILGLVMVFGVFFALELKDTR